MECIESSQVLVRKEKTGKPSQHQASVKTHSIDLLRRGSWVRVPAGSPLRTIDRTFKATFRLFLPDESFCAQCSEISHLVVRREVDFSSALTYPSPCSKNTIIGTILEFSSSFVTILLCGIQFTVRISKHHRPVKTCYWPLPSEACLTPSLDTMTRRKSWAISRSPSLFG